MERDWARLGRAFAEARDKAGLTQVEVAERIGVTRTPIQAIERGHIGGKPFTRVTGTMRSYARLLGWTEGSIEIVLAGGDPIPEAPAQARPAEAVDEPHVPPRISEELREGQVLDNGVYDLTPEDEDFQLLVIVKGKKGATREEISRYMRKWRRVERELRRMGELEDGEPGSTNA